MMLVGAGVVHVGGDMFSSIPSADAIFMKVSYVHHLLGFATYTSTRVFWTSRLVSGLPTLGLQEKPNMINLSQA